MVEVVDVVDPRLENACFAVVEGDGPGWCGSAQDEGCPCVAGVAL